MRLKKHLITHSCRFIALTGIIFTSASYAGDSIMPGSITGDTKLESKSAGNFLPTGSVVDTGLAIHNGEVWVWGFRGSGQQGNGAMVVNQRSAPAKVKIFSDNNIKIIALASGIYHIIALDENGDVWGWGQSGYGETGCGITYISTPCKVIEGKKIIKIAAGEYFSAALSADGDVYTWGDGLYGQRGDGTLHRYSAFYTKPQVVHKVDLAGEKARLLTAHYESAFVVTESGKFMGWGDNETCELGPMVTLYNPTHCDGRHEYISKPREFAPGINAHDVIDITGGNRWSEVLLKDGSVWGWGLGASIGLTDNGSTDSKYNSAVARKILDNVAILYGRYVGSAALTKSGDFYTWGLTNGSAFPDIYGHRPTLRTPTHGVVEGFGGGKEHLYYWTFDGKLYGYGYGAAYKLDPNSADNIPWPGEEMTFILAED